MQIETYEVEEHTTEGRDPFEIEAEAEALIESLGLEGQRALLKPSADDVDTKTRVPYRRMTRDEMRVYQTLYPEAVEVTAYDAGPIPLRVLQVIAHARTMFDRCEVWGPQVKDPDPVLVGIMKSPGQFGGTDTRHYLLARWGDALAPFEELKERAIERVREEWLANARRVIAKCQAFVAAPDGSVLDHLSGEWVHEPWTT